MFGQTLGWYTATELLGLLVIMAVAIAVLHYNKQVARVFANLAGANWPPGGLIREDRPEKIQEQRELHQTMLIVCRVMVLLGSALAAGGCVFVLVRGPS